VPPLAAATAASDEDVQQEFDQQEKADRAGDA
jgi:hypothetical protein